MRISSIILKLISVLLVMASPVAAANDATKTPTFQAISPHFIAALGDPNAPSGTGAETWGYWDHDPGPRGIWLRLFPIVRAAGGFAPSGWQFNPDDWWLDENGLIMEAPDFPMQPGQYLVTGEREVTTILTVHEPDETGAMKWELAEGNLFDVTHWPCRSARYTPASAGEPCSPNAVDKSLFKIPPNTPMPHVPGCAKQDYSVLIVVGLPAES